MWRIDCQLENDTTQTQEFQGQEEAAAYYQGCLFQDGVKKVVVWESGQKKEKVDGQWVWVRTWELRMWSA